MKCVCERRACVLHVVVACVLHVIVSCVVHVIAACVCDVIVACVLHALTSVWQGGKKMAGLFMKLMQQHAVLQQGAA